MFSTNVSLLCRPKVHPALESAITKHTLPAEDVARVLTTFRRADAPAVASLNQGWGNVSCYWFFFIKLGYTGVNNFVFPFWPKKNSWMSDLIADYKPKICKY